MIRTCLSLVAALVSCASARAQDVQWIQHPSGLWYGLGTQYSTWFEAEALGVAHGGHLATIGDAGLRAWLDQNVRIEAPSPGNVWIGWNDLDVEGSFEWTSELASGYTNWAPGTPLPIPAAFERDVTSWGSPGWIDYQGTQLFPSLIETPRAPSAGYRIAERLQPGNMRGLFTGDFDGDGLLDVVTIDFATDRIVLLLARPGGTFQTVFTTTGDQPRRLAVGDLDLDGDLDVVVLGNGASISTFLGDGAGALVAGPVVAIQDIASDVAIGDVVGDARIDLVYSLGTLDAVGARPGIAGGFGPATTVAVGDSPFTLVTVDDDQDGDDDVLVSCTDSRLFRLVNAGGVLTPSLALTTSSFALQVSVGDLDGDGDSDLALPLYLFTNGARVAWNSGNGTYTPGPLLTLIGSPQSCAIGDLDLDGIADVATLESGGTVTLFRGTGGGAFTAGARLSSGPGGLALRIEQLRGDPRPELLVADAYGVDVIDRLFQDCNGNAIDDPADLTAGTSSDANADGAPDECQRVGVHVCSGDGSAAACPCAPGSTAGAGCANSLGLSGNLEAVGRPQLAYDTLRLVATGLPPSAAGLFFQGDTSVGGGAGAAFGDGLRCAGGATVRLGIRQASSGASSFGEGTPGDPLVHVAGAVPSSGSLRTYQLWYRDVAPSYCTTSTFNLTNGVEVTWTP